MKEVKIPGKCPGCNEDIFVKINLFTMKVLGIFLAEPPANYGQKMQVVDFYKELKGLDKISTWNGSYKGRALKTVGKILHVFRKLVDPVAIALELVNDISERAKRERWSDWNLDTCAARAGQWLADQQGEKK